MKTHEPPTEFQCSVCDYKVCAFQCKHITTHFIVIKHINTTIDHKHYYKYQLNMELSTHWRFEHNSGKWSNPTSWESHLVNYCSILIAQPFLTTYFLHKSKFGPLQCNIKAELYRHMTKMHGTKDFRCDQCELSFKSLSNLNRHQYVHAEKNLQCNQCEWRQV